MARPTVISLTPPVVGLALYAGDGANLRLVAVDLDGEPFDLRGVVRAQIRKQRLDAEALAEFDVEMAEAEQGVVVLRLTSDDTRALMDGAAKFKGAWDCQWRGEGDDAQPLTLMQGDVVCDLDVTREASR